jgi:hypothetical protein
MINIDYVHFQHRTVIYFVPNIWQYLHNCTFLWTRVACIPQNGVTHFARACSEPQTNSPAVPCVTIHNFQIPPTLIFVWHINMIENSQETNMAKRRVPEIFERRSHSYFVWSTKEDTYKNIWACCNKKYCRIHASRPIETDILALILIILFACVAGV